MDDLRDLVERYARTADPQYFAVDATFQDVARDEGFAGQAAIGTMLRSFLYEAFSDVEIAVRTVVVDAEGGHAAVEWTFRGRHSGDLWGIPLTGRRVELAMLGVYEIEDGLIRSARLYYDMATLLRQLGPAPERAQRAPAGPPPDLAPRARRWITGLTPRWRRAREVGRVTVAALVRRIREGTQQLPHADPLVLGRRWIAGRTPRWRRPRQLRRVTVAALVGTIVVAVLVGQAVLAPAPAAAAEASLTILDGDVGVSRGDGGLVAATDGQAVRSGDTVRTGDGAHAVLTYFDGSTATIEPLSEIVVEGISLSPSGELVVRIRQTIGHTWHVVTHRPSGQSNYHVRTPSASAVVRGTAFEVKVKPKAGSPQEVVTEVATTDGEVGVTSPAAPEIEVKVTEGAKTDVEPQARPKEPEVIPEPDVKVKVTLDAVRNAVVVQQNGLAVGVQQGQAVRYAPGSKVTVENGKLVMEIPNVQAGRLSSIVQGASTDTRSVRIETEVSSGNVVVARTVEDRPLEKSEDPARSGTVAKGGIILTPVGVVVLPDDEAKKAVEANIGKAPAAPAAAGFVPNVIPRAEQRPAILVPESLSPPPAAGATGTAPPQPSPAATPFTGTFQAFVLTGIASGTPTGSPIPGTPPGTVPSPGAAFSLDALPPQVLSVLFASNPGHMAKPVPSIESAAPATPGFVPPGQVGTAPPTAPGVFCDERGQPPGCIPFAAGPTPVPPQGAPVFCDQRGQPPGCIPPYTTAFLPGGIFAAGGVFGVGGFFDPTARRGPEAPGAPAPPRALFTPPPALVLDGTCGLAGYRSCFAGETPRQGLVPFGPIAPAIGCGIPGDPRCFSGSPIQGITCGFTGGPICPSNALPPGSTAPPGAIPGLDGNCGLPGLRGCFAGETPRPGLVGPPIAAPGTFPGITGPTRGVTCDGPGLPTCPPNAVDPPPGFVLGRPFPAGPGFGQFDGTCGLPGLRPCFPGETPRPGLQPQPFAGQPPGTVFCDNRGQPTGCIPQPSGAQPGFAPGFFPVSGPTRGITCDGPGLPTCPPNAVDAPPGFRPGQPFPGGPGVAPTQPAAGIPFDAVCGQAGFRACAPGETPQHVIGVTCGTPNLPSCPAEAKRPAPGPQLGPGQVYCDNRGQPPGCVAPGGVPPAQGVPVPGPGQPTGDGTCGLPGYRPCSAGETPRPGLPQQPGFAPGFFPGGLSGPTRGITCDGPGLPTCPPNAVDAPPGFRPGQGPTPGATCGGPGLPACPGQQPFPGPQQQPFQPGQQPPFGPQPPFQPGQPPYPPGTQPFQPAQPPGASAPAQPPPGGFQPGQQPPGGFQPGQQPPFGPQPPFQPGQPPYPPGTQPFQPAQPPGASAPAQPPPGGVAPGFVPQPAPVLPFCDGFIITTNCRPPGG